MERPGLCDHCGGELYTNADDGWWICADCGCTWTLNGELLSAGEECVIARNRDETRRPLPVGLSEVVEFD